jgi:NTE family protein
MCCLGSASMAKSMTSRRNVTLVFSGGIALGAYQAGAYGALQEHADFQPSWLAGSSIGAVNAAVIAGNRADDRVERLRALWKQNDQLASYDPSGLLWPQDHLRHMENWTSAIRTRLVGSAGHFRPRVVAPWERFTSLYDLSPLRERLLKLIDFELLNGGEVRLSVAATDIETGDLVMFDTAKGDRIEVDHLLASCGYLPEFAPLEIAGRLLGDGGLSANAPIEALLDHPPHEPLTCFVVDLFARDGSRPADLETAVARKSDLMFANQTWQRLEAYCRERKLRIELAEHANSGKNKGSATTIYYLSYRPDHSEAGSERTFDYSSRSVASRWEAGALDMNEALAIDTRSKPGKEVKLIPVRRALAPSRTDADAVAS